MGTPWAITSYGSAVAVHFILLTRPEETHGQEMGEERSDLGQERWLIKPGLAGDQGFK